MPVYLLYCPKRLGASIFFGAVALQLVIDPNASSGHNPAKGGPHDAISVVHIIHPVGGVGPGG